MKIVALLMAAFFLVSCGKGGKPVTPKQRGLTGKGDQPVVDPTKVLCPAQVPPSFHRVSLHFNRPLPSHIGIRLDTDAAVRISDCADLSQNTGPLVSFSRLTGNDLVVNIEHRGFYASLPRDVGLEIYDLRACGAEMISFFKVAPAVPVTWRMESPNGTNCASRAVGDYKGSELVGDASEAY